MTRDRMRDSYPLTWEIPAAATCLLAVILVAGVHLGRAIANVTVTGRWMWPSPATVVGSLPGVLSGDARAGLAASGTTAVADAVWLQGCIAVTEAVLVAVIIVAAVWMLRRWSPNVTPGMASRSEVQQMLGVERLHKVRAVVRPDLYPERGKRWRP